MLLGTLRHGMATSMAIAKVSFTPHGLCGKGLRDQHPAVLTVGNYVSPPPLAAHLLFRPFIASSPLRRTSVVFLCRHGWSGERRGELNVYWWRLLCCSVFPDLLLSSLPRCCVFWFVLLHRLLLSSAACACRCMTMICALLCLVASGALLSDSDRSVYVC